MYLTIVLLVTLSLSVDANQGKKFGNIVLNLEANSHFLVSPRLPDRREPHVRLLWPRPGRDRPQALLQGLRVQGGPRAPHRGHVLHGARAHRPRRRLQGGIIIVCGDNKHYVNFLHRVWEASVRREPSASREFALRRRQEDSSGSSRSWILMITRSCNVERHKCKHNISLGVNNNHWWWISLKKHVQILL